MTCPIWSAGTRVKSSSSITITKTNHSKTFNSLKVFLILTLIARKKLSAKNLIVSNKKSTKSFKSRKGKAKSSSSTKINLIKLKLKSRKSSWASSLSWKNEMPFTHSTCSCSTASIPIFHSFSSQTKKYSLHFAHSPSQFIRQRMLNKWRIWERYWRFGGISRWVP